MWIHLSTGLPDYAAGGGGVMPVFGGVALLEKKRPRFFV